MAFPLTLLANSFADTNDELRLKKIAKKKAQAQDVAQDLAQDTLR